MESTTYQFFNQNALPMDAKSAVGSKQFFKTLDALLTFANTKAPSSFADGMIINDHDYGVSWQLYKDTTWKARLYDGEFHVRCVSGFSYENATGFPPSFNIDIQGAGSYDGITPVENDIVLVFSGPGCLNGVWIVHLDEPWERHPLFDESADNFSAITIVVDEGTIYKNSQWKFTTIGEITPSTLYSEISLAYNDPETFNNYTWLSFELIGGGYLTSTTPYANRMTQRHLINASSSDITMIALVAELMPYRNYIVQKTDNTSNLVYLLNKLNGDVRAILSKPRDWCDMLLTTANPTAISGASYAGGAGTWYDDTEIVVTSNRSFEVITPTSVTADGQLDESVPSGYLTAIVVLWISTAGTDNAHVQLGKTAGTDTIQDDITLNDDGMKEYLVINDNTITDIFISEVDSGDFNGNTVSCKIYIIKE